MLPASIKRHVLANGSHFKLVLVLEYLRHRSASTEEPYFTPSTWVSKNLVEMSLKLFFMSPNNFLLEKDLRAMKWVVSTCLLDKRIMKNHSVSLCSQEELQKKFKMSLYGENFQGDNMGILGSTRGQKTPNHVKICSPPA